MKHTMKLMTLLAVVAISALMVLGLAACGKDKATVGDYLDEGYELGISISNEADWGAVLVKDGQYLKVISHMTKDQVAAFGALDVMDDDYDAQYAAVVRGLTVASATDLMPLIPSKQEMDSFVGKTLGTLEDAGYEVDGYSSWDDNVCVFASTDILSLRVDVSGANPDDDVMEYSDQARRQLVITNVEFLEFNFGVFNG
ncbi:MAG: hypothetical protein IKD70_02555 [Eggerthellaceae bacterium]|nr:hypothetical protein [Eggerthellaceae bacterium]